MRISVTDANGQIQNHGDPKRNYPLTVLVRSRRQKVMFVTPEMSHKLPEMRLVDAAIMRMTPNQGFGRYSPFKFEGKSYPKMESHDPFTELQWKPDPKNRKPTAHHILMTFGVDAGPPSSKLQKPGSGCPTMVRYLLHLSDLMVTRADEPQRHAHELCNFVVPYTILWGLIMLRSFNRWWTVPGLMNESMWCWMNPRPDHKNDTEAFKPVNATALQDNVYLKIWMCVPANAEPQSLLFTLTHRGDIPDPTDSTGEGETDAEGDEFEPYQPYRYMPSSSQPKNIPRELARPERMPPESMPHKSRVSVHSRESFPSRTRGFEDYEQFGAPVSTSHMPTRWEDNTLPTAPLQFETDTQDPFHNPPPSSWRRPVLEDTFHGNQYSLEKHYMNRVLPNELVHPHLTRKQFEDLIWKGTGIPLTAPAVAPETVADRTERSHPEDARHTDYPMEMPFSSHGRADGFEYVDASRQPHVNQFGHEEIFPTDEYNDFEPSDEPFSQSVPKHAHGISAPSSTPRHRKPRYESTRTGYGQQWVDPDPNPVDPHAPTSPLYRLSSLPPSSYQSPRAYPHGDMLPHEPANIDHSMAYNQSNWDEADAAGSFGYRPSGRSDRQHWSEYSSRPDGRPGGQNTKMPGDPRQGYSSSPPRSYWPKD
ncbi:hypothetical protein Dda_4263 [Drechslerella dactyloides]|uniref:Uncharacterized protein n=1 Tax=Drechslerella dactyloides TaxID=74499 RepID=A0AAD6NLV9_DREDA|nr:hypothetical protein Dda_4263 [Drechslerella dactyloides]